MTVTVPVNMAARESLPFEYLTRLLLLNVCGGRASVTENILLSSCPKIKRLMGVNTVNFGGILHPSRSLQDKLILRVDRDVDDEKMLDLLGFHEKEQKRW